MGGVIEHLSCFLNGVSYTWEHLVDYKDHHCFAICLVSRHQNVTLSAPCQTPCHGRAHGGAVTAEALRAYEKARIPRVKNILSYMEFQPERQALVVEDCLGEVSPQRQDVSAA